MRQRVATAADVALYFDWANDPETRRQSFSSTPINLTTHERWFSRKVVDPDALLLVFETNEGRPVGQVRFEKQADHEIIIGLSVDAAFRGQGLAAAMIREGSEVCLERWTEADIVAYIKPDNLASVRAFERAGFVRQDSGQPDRLRLVKHYAQKR